MLDKIKEIEKTLDNAKEGLQQVEKFFNENGYLEYTDSPNESFEQGYVNALEYVLRVLKG